MRKILFYNIISIPTMKAINNYILLLLVTVFLSCNSEKERLLSITGIVVNSDTKSILLVKPHQNMMFDSLIEIPVINGKFEYISKLKNPEAVKLFLGEAKESGGGSYMPLFLENEEIDLVIYPEEEWSNSVVHGGKYNEEYKQFKNILYLELENLQSYEDSLRILRENYEESNNKILNLSTKLENTRNEDAKSAIQSRLIELENDHQMIILKAGQIEEKLNALYSQQKDFQHTYMKNNPTLVSYYFLLNDLISYTSYKEIFGTETVDISLAKKTVDSLSKAYPHHPYNELALNLINAIENIKIGKKYIDFSAPDLSGKTVQLSDHIKGKIALLNLWATWCGPCIKKSRTMVPIYEEFKDKGFTIVGVAGEYKNTDRLAQFLEKEKWPWLNLVELERQNNIWQTYGISNSGGGIFLIDANGKILAKDPTAEEVRREILNRLN